MAYPKGVLDGKLVKVVVNSIYGDHSQPLPERMAWFCPEAAADLHLLLIDLHAAGGELYLSDGFRSEEMQAKAHFDYLTGTSQLKKRQEFVAKYPQYLTDYVASNGGKGKVAFSPPPGGSWHESGRAMDIDTDPKWLKVSLDKFRAIAKAHGWTKIDSESWHFEYRGPFQKKYEEFLKIYDSGSAYKLAAKAAVGDLYGRA